MKIFPQQILTLGLFLVTANCKAPNSEYSGTTSSNSSAALQAQATNLLNPTGFSYASDFESIKSNCMNYQPVAKHAISRQSTESLIQVKESVSELKKSMNISLTGAISSKILGSSRKLAPTAKFISELNASKSSLFINLEYKILNETVSLIPTGFDQEMILAIQRSGFQKWLSSLPQEKLDNIWQRLGQPIKIDSAVSSIEVFKLFHANMITFHELDIYTALLKKNKPRASSIVESAIKNTLSYTEEDRRKYIRDVFSVFHYTCGDSFLTSYNTGTHLSSVIQVHDLSKEKKKELALSLKAAISKNKKVDGNLKKISNTDFSRHSKTIWYEQTGGSSETSVPLFTMEELLERITHLNCFYSNDDSCKNNSAEAPIIGFETSTYDTVPESGDLFSYIIRQDYGSMLKNSHIALTKLSERALKYRSILYASKNHSKKSSNERIQSLLSHSYRALDMIEQSILDCFYDYAFCPEIFTHTDANLGSIPVIVDPLLQHKINVAHEIQSEVGLNLESLGLDEVPNCLAQTDPAHVRKREKLNLCVIDTCFIYDQGYTDKFETKWISNSFKYLGSKSEWDVLPATRAECEKE